MRSPSLSCRACSLAGLVWALVALAGCGGADAPVREPSVQVFGDAIEVAAYRKIVDAYREKTGRSVRLVALADRDSHLAKLTTSFSAGRPPDAFLLSYRNFGPFAARGVLDPVGPLLDASRAVRRGDLYPVAVRAFTTSGTLQCLPLNASGLVVYVNLGLFEAAGLPAPAGPWTFESFYRTALELRSYTRTTGNGTHALGIDPNIGRLAPFVWSAGGSVVDDDAAPSRFTLDSRRARRGIDRFLSLYREALVPTENAVEAEALDVQFRAGRIAMYVSSRRDVPTFRGVGGLTWDVVPYPRAESSATVLHSDGLCLARGGAAAAAWDFVEFAGGPEGQRILARAGRVVPALRPVAESSDFLQPGRAPRNAKAFLDAMATVRALPNTENWPRIEDSASLAFKRAFYAEVTVQDAIDRVNAETEGLF